MIVLEWYDRDDLDRVIRLWWDAELEWDVPFPCWAPLSANHVDVDMFSEACDYLTENPTTDPLMVNRYLDELNVRRGMAADAAATRSP